MRVPKPFFVKSRKTWYVQIDGKQHNLGKDRTEAMTQYKELLGDSVKAASELAKPKALVLDLIAEFLSWSDRHNPPSTFHAYQRHLKHFSEWLSDAGLAKLTIRDIRPFHVTKWLDARYDVSVSDSTRAGAIAAIKRPFNWAYSEGYIKENPIGRVKKPKYVPRGDEAYITDEQFEKLLEAVRDTPRPEEATPFEDYLIVLKDTGCRPQEIRTIEAKHLDLENRLWRFPSQARGKLKNRLVPLPTDRVVEICRRLALKYPEGPIFRNADGKPWTAFSVNCRFRRLAEKTGIKGFAYAFRHTFATNEILKGTDIITLKHMMGHADLQMLGKVYEHVERARKVSQAAKKQAKTKRPDTDAA